MQRDTSPRIKIAFRLEQDEDGWPPTSWELMWAFPRSGDTAELDNIPFFAKGVASGDLVVFSRDEDQLTFAGLLLPGGHSTIRVIMYELDQKAATREALEAMGCETEGSHLPSLFAVDVPPNADYQRVTEFLNEKSVADVLEYEEGAIRHQLDT
jgi:hypothetical protein